MNTVAGRSKIRQCLANLKPDLDLEQIDDDTPLLESRVITSFDVLELILHLEDVRGRPIDRRELVPGSFRDVATISRVFLENGDSE